MRRALAAASAAELGRTEAGQSPLREAGEQRQVRLIVAGVLRDMLAQLA
jgi:hypothetical protein